MISRFPLKTKRTLQAASTGFILPNDSGPATSGQRQNGNLFVSALALIAEKIDSRDSGRRLRS
jgi:hypothetical protein